MREKLMKLLEIKSIITLIIIFVFAVLALQGKLERETVTGIIILVLNNYFNYQHGKNTNEKIEK